MKPRPSIPSVFTVIVPYGGQKVTATMKNALSTVSTPVTSAAFDALGMSADDTSGIAIGAEGGPSMPWLTWKNTGKVCAGVVGGVAVSYGYSRLTGRKAK